MSYSNTVLLEREFGWDGILAEPDRSQATDIEHHRKCHFEKDCLWSRSGETIAFLAAEEGTLSTIASFAKTDHHDRSRATTYDVTTISLSDMLKKYDAPSTIDYLSVDTEGSEFEILNAFDFERHIFCALKVEHNYVADRRESVFDLLKRNDYLRVLTDVTQVDDWFVHHSVLSEGAEQTAYT